MKQQQRALSLITSQRGMTLVELMIVVAIIGVLASVAGVAFFRQIKNAKITQMEQYAMDLARGQEEFWGRHGVYYPLNAADETLDATQDANSASTVRGKVRQVLSFDRPDLPTGMTIQLAAGRPGQNCNIAACNNLPLDIQTSWFVVVVEQDLNPGEAENTRVIVTSTNPRPLRRNEGM